MEARAADLDGDGDLDLLIAREHEPNILLLNDGSGRFTDQSDRIPQLVRDSEDIAIADFDGDGDLDVIVVSEDDLQGTGTAPKHEYYLNDGTGRFADVSARIALPTRTNAVAAGDIDGDGDIDLVFGNDGRESVLVNDGAGRFSDESTSRMPGSGDVTQDVVLGDVDGDGDLDLLVANESGGANRLLLNDGRGVFAEAPAGSIPLRQAPEATRNAELADVDKDGDLDVFFANVIFAGGHPQSRLLLNDGTGRFTDATSERLPVMTAGAIDGDFVDIDHDGDLDLLTSPFPASRYRAFINNGAGSFADKTDTIFPSNLMGQGVEIEAADFNGDGRRDVYLANFSDSPDMLLLARSQ